MHEIKEFFEKKEKGVLQCRLCPHNCVIVENKKGLCGTRVNQNGKFYSIVYAKPSALHIDPIEKKPLYHFHPGEEILSVGTLGCNLFCRGCQNYDISKELIKKPIDRLPEVMPEEIVQNALDNDINMNESYSD